MNAGKLQEKNKRYMSGEKVREKKQGRCKGKDGVNEIVRPMRWEEKCRESKGCTKGGKVYGRWATVMKECTFVKI